MDPIEFHCKEETYKKCVGFYQRKMGFSGFVVIMYSSHGRALSVSNRYKT